MRSFFRKNLRIPKRHFEIKWPLANVHFDHVKIQKADTVLSRHCIYITWKLCFYSVQKKAMLNFKKLSSLTNYVWALEKEKKNHRSFSLFRLLYLSTSIVQCLEIFRVQNLEISRLSRFCTLEIFRRCTVEVERSSRWKKAFLRKKCWKEKPPFLLKRHTTRAIKLIVLLVKKGFAIKLSRLKLVS